MEGLWQHPCMRGGAGRCLLVTLVSVMGLRGGVKPGWVSGGGGSVSMRDRNTVESDVQK